MTWNYRVMATEYKGVIIFEIRGVYYDDNNEPEGYTDEPTTIGGESLNDINDTVIKIEGAIKKPIIWTGDKFPNEYK